MLSAPSGCQVCEPRASARLSKCPRCKAVQYCGREHQRADLKAHEAVCKRIKTYRQRMAEGVEHFWGEDTFETQVGHFWELVDTRLYMQGKMGVLTELSTINSRLAIEAALAEAMDCHRLCHSDNMGVRDVTPTLMLLLGQLQEAYAHEPGQIDGATIGDVVKEKEDQSIQTSFRTLMQAIRLSND